jgi:hypothetical protein
MRGGVSIHDLFHVCSADDRALMYNVIEDNIDATKKTKLPLL